MNDIAKEVVRRFTVRAKNKLDVRAVNLHTTLLLELIYYILTAR